MHPNNSNQDEAKWDLEEFLGEEELDVEEPETEGKADTQSSRDTNAEPAGSDTTGSSSTYDMEQLMQEAEAEVKTSRSEAESQQVSVSRWLFRNGLALGTCAVLAAGLIYMSGTFEGAGQKTAPQRPQAAMQARSEQDLQRWLKQMERLESTLSHRDLRIQSSSLVGFSSEIERSPDLKLTVSNTLNNDSVRSFRLVTRDIGNALNTLKSGSSTNSNGTESPLQKNQKLVQRHQEEIEEAWSALRIEHAPSSTGFSVESAGSSGNPSAGTLPEDKQPTIK